MGHHHDDHEHHHGNLKSLVISLIIASSIAGLEIFGGTITKSLALLADGGHMLIDSFALIISLIALKLTLKHGSRKFEKRGAIINGCMLIAISLWIIYEAIVRFSEGVEPVGRNMMIIAIIGLLANVVSLIIMKSLADVKENVNMRGAYLHLISDAVGSVGAIAAGIIMNTWQWYLADPIISIIISIIFIRGGWNLVRAALQIKMDEKLR